MTPAPPPANRDHDREFPLSAATDKYANHIFEVTIRIHVAARPLTPTTFKGLHLVAAAPISPDHLKPDMQTVENGETFFAGAGEIELQNRESAVIV